MNPYIIHKIALYLKDADRVRILMYNDSYRKYVEENDTIYDELIWYYTRCKYHDDLKITKSIYRQIDRIGKYYQKKKRAYLMTGTYYSSANPNFFISHDYNLRMYGDDIVEFDNVIDEIKYNIIKNNNLTIFKWLNMSKLENYDMLGLIWYDRKEIIQWLLEEKKLKLRAEDVYNSIRLGKYNMMRWIDKKIKKDNDKIEIIKINNFLTI